MKKVNKNSKNLVRMEKNIFCKRFVGKAEE